MGEVGRDRMVRFDLGMGNDMNKMMIAAAAVLAVVALGGCTSEVVGKASAAPTTAPATTYTPPTTTVYTLSTTPPLVGVDQAYVLMVRGGTGITEARYSDNSLLTVARLVCQVLNDSVTRNGTSPGAGELIGTIQGVAQVTGFSNGDAGVVTGAAISARCPQYLYLVR